MQVSDHTKQTRIDRHIHRIEQIMHSKTKTSPARIRNKSPASISMHDSVIKYQLSSNIIQQFINKKHRVLLACFFNECRFFQPVLHDRVIKYRVVEKESSSRRLEVDNTISGKLLACVIKGIYHKSYLHMFSVLKKAYTRGKSSLK